MLAAGGRQNFLPTPYKSVVSETYSQPYRPEVIVRVYR